ncbi:MAG: hypothetical protein CBB68_12315 [Rhodospirillaceae bacterium TMED8]|nr:hypothetical protein [Magnetovibrio sp.]OUT48895.1 MAG: hypothetical protein CBB68_12315 [Rhodospirillaceae bacterium TMED8]|tara:strand:- start:3260 stop:4240 length:981 start_codon:yes stop_codon:yes gene_type:complete
MLVLPKILASSVIRSSEHSHAHGGLYLVDLNAGRSEQVLSWDRSNISFRGRGAERGLRGIAFFNNLTYIANNDSILVFDRLFNQIDEIENAYFGDLHEMVTIGNHLWVTSSGFDSLISINLNTHKCVDGYCVRDEWNRRLNKFLWRVLGIERPAGALINWFDPNNSHGPARNDVTHLNTVSTNNDQELYISLHRGKWLYRMAGERLEKVIPIPLGAHNAQPFLNNFIYNDTENGRAVKTNSKGQKILEFPSVSYPKEQMEGLHLGHQIAKPQFVRGLCVFSDKVVIIGSSPATVTAFNADSGEQITSVNISMDVRNCIHGLEVFSN